MSLLSSARRGAIALCAVVSMAAIAPAFAAEDGLPAGNFVIRPSVRADLVFDSNVYRTAPGTAEMDLGVSVRPEIQILYPGENFRWDLAAYYRFFTFFNLGGTNHENLRVVANFGVRTHFDVNRKGKFGFEFGPEIYNRPFNRGNGEGTERQLGVYTPLRLNIRPTSAFVITPKVGWEWSRVYGPSLALDPSSTVFGNRHQVGGGIALDWRFFPRSHFVFDSDVGTTLWGDADYSGLNFAKPENGIYWRVNAGVRGDLSRKLAILAMVGYGNVYFSGNPAQNLTGIEGLLGKVELALMPAASQRLAIGFSRDFRFAYFANHLEETSAYFKYSGVFADRLTAGADFTYTLRNIVGSLTRLEHQLAAGVALDVAIVRWLHVGGGYRFSTLIPAAGATSGNNVDHRIVFGVTVGYKPTRSEISGGNLGNWGTSRGR